MNKDDHCNVLSLFIVYLASALGDHDEGETIIVKPTVLSTYNNGSLEIHYICSLYRMSTGLPKHKVLEVLSYVDRPE